MLEEYGLVEGAKFKKPAHYVVEKSISGLIFTLMVIHKAFLTQGTMRKCSAVHSKKFIHP